MTRRAAESTVPSMLPRAASMKETPRPAPARPVAPRVVDASCDGHRGDAGEGDAHQRDRRAGDQRPGGGLSGDASCRARAARPAPRSRQARRPRPRPGRRSGRPRRRPASPHDRAPRPDGCAGRPRGRSSGRRARPGSGRPGAGCSPRRSGPSPGRAPACRGSRPRSGCPAPGARGASRSCPSNMAVVAARNTAMPRIHAGRVIRSRRSARRTSRTVPVKPLIAPSPPRQPHAEPARRCPRRSGAGTAPRAWAAR